MQLVYRPFLVSVQPEELSLQGGTVLLEIRNPFIITSPSNLMLRLKRENHSEGRVLTSVVVRTISDTQMVLEITIPAKLSQKGTGNISVVPVEVTIQPYLARTAQVLSSYVCNILDCEDTET